VPQLHCVASTVRLTVLLVYAFEQCGHRCHACVECVQLRCVMLQEDCARILLFRGADRSIKNFANQTAAEVAIIADNAHISDLINNFKTDDVGRSASSLSFPASFVCRFLHCTACLQL